MGRICYNLAAVGSESCYFDIWHMVLILCHGTAMLLRLISLYYANTYLLISRNIDIRTTEISTIIGCTQVGAAFGGPLILGQLRTNFLSI